MLIVVKTRLIGKFMTWTQRPLRDRQRRSRSNLTQDVGLQSYAEISQSGACLLRRLQVFHDVAVSFEYPVGLLRVWSEGPIVMIKSST